MKFQTKSNKFEKPDQTINNGQVLWVKRRKIAPQNIVKRLFERSINLHNRTQYQNYRKFYQSITPNFTVCNVKKPPCFLRKFSPCGRYLIAFSADQTSVEIYGYLGAAAANDLLHHCRLEPGESVLHGNEATVTHVLQNIFGRFFRLRSSVVASTNQEQLNRECSLFSSDAKFVIVGSASSRDSGAISRLGDAYRNNESVTSNPRSPLDDYTLHIIDLESGVLCDRVTFKHDKIFLSHNQGLSLHNSTLVVLSVQHQTLHVYHVTGDGKFVAIQSIGRTCFVDDDVFLHSCVAHDCRQLQQTTRASQQQSGGGDSSRPGSISREQPRRQQPPTGVFPPSQQQQPVRRHPTLPPVGGGVARLEALQQLGAGPSSMFPSHSSMFSSNSLFSQSLLSHLSPPPPPSPPPGGPQPPRRPVFPRPPQRPQPLHNHEEGSNIIYSLKHRVLVFLYRLAQQRAEAQSSPEPTQLFCSSFEVFLQLRMLKMQLLDDNHLLIKYASEDVVTLRSSEPGCQPSYFVVYKMDTAEVVNVYENSSMELMSLYEQFTDFFRNARLPCEPNYLCSPANNTYARQLHEKHKATLISSRGGGVTEASKRLLAQLPVACQAFSPSPYLDLSLFTYQDKYVSVMERPKTAADHPIRFYGRDSGLLKFSLDAGGRYLPPTPPPSIHRRLVAFTFHPIDPFAISVQKHMDDYVVSFHVMHKPASPDRS